MLEEFAPGPLTSLDLLLRLSLAALLGGVLGFEREYRQKPAGLRTHMVVALGAACFSLAAFGLARYGGEVAHGTIMDPTRIMQGIVGGIGFLGAGAILRDRGNVEGLTTAGSLWLCGAVGIAAGTGNYVLATLTVALALAILVVLGRLEREFGKRRDAARDDRGDGE